MAPIHPNWLALRHFVRDINKLAETVNDNTSKQRHIDNRQTIWLK